MINMTFLGGVLGLLPVLFLVEKAQKHPLKKSYRSYFRRAQIKMSNLAFVDLSPAKARGFLTKMATMTSLRSNR